ncbi:unnamed protein product [Arctia plantaginis]|uniref:MGA conserved domain-containing protein n=1 Tax=Arctia plantaginis TaxID=874455 RepID=A0A8S0ZVA3_ARCPL|nr:unnamed protein product [Arctia plantaginis]
MEEKNKVFYSAIIRTGQRHKNNLYDLLKIIPAAPLECNNVKTYTCDFKPKTDKIYVPKRRPKAKVKTVRDIRTSFENETYTFLTRDLEIQQNYLLKKIRVGSSKNQNTQNIAKKILKSDSPISRSTWQMLVNLNPDQEKHPQQFVLWNGNFLQVNGSKGGNNRLICNYDLANMKIPLQVKNKIIKNKKNTNKSSGLLRNSLAIKFKPGPLGRKKFLDDSHQKYQGDVELVDLPKVGLVVKPTYGTPLEATISNFVSIVCKDDGIISEKWAEFAISVLGKIEKSDARLVNGDCVTFDLKYKYDQHRILMRKDLDNKYFTPSVTETSTVNEGIGKAQPYILSEIEDMMDKIINAVEIHINQYSMFSEDDDSRQTVLKVSDPVEMVTVSKDKTKRKYSELDRLDVTVIRIPENLEKDSTQSCGNMHCTLGCICDSIKNTCYIKQHCGREECMFNCKCDFSKYSNINLDMNGSDSTELIPGIKNIEDKINTRLAKEEQKFHQTVIVSGENNILLKSEKRSWKSSKKYGTFYKHMCLKNVNPGNRILSISALRLNCENVEPWCMVHNLYKCFCKGKITTSNTSSIFQTITQEPIYKDSDVECPPKIQTPLPRSRRHNAVNLDDPGKDFVSGKTSDVSSINLERKQKTRNISDILSNHQRLSSTSEMFDSFSNENKQDVYISDSSNPDESCSRVIGYEGRKYSNEHYQEINNKIKNMEKNDKMLQKKIMKFLNPEVLKVHALLEEKQQDQDTVKEKTSVKDLETDLYKDNTLTEGIQKDNISSEEISKDQNQNKYLLDVNGVIGGGEDKTKNKLRCTEKKLVGWLETNYKLYKKRVDEGLITTSLEPPRVGKIALHPWDFILSRYRERKNLFLISKQKPYRIFMGVHTRNPFFESCININEIRFADLHKYPQTVKNLLTNATHLKDLFCILRGLAHCWELAGSVAKVSKSDDNTDDINDVISDTNSNSPSHLGDSPNKQQLSIREYEDETVPSSILKDDDGSNSDCPTEAESSKWFIMTVENDFSEIRFYKKGFFVKYESIVKAINVARLSKKTVIENPLSFMPSSDLNENKAVPIESHYSDDKKLNENEPQEILHLKEFDETQQKTLLKLDSKKIIKPIKICKTNGFYHLATGNLLKKVNLQSPRKVIIKPPLNISTATITNKSLLLDKSTFNVENSTLRVSKVLDVEESPQIKISAVYSQRDAENVKNNRNEKGMFILKPEEINRRLFENQINTETTLSQEMATDTSGEISSPKSTEYQLFQDQNFKISATLTPYTINEDICIISDDEDDSNNEHEGSDRWKQIRIMCTDVPDIGFIWGRQKCESHLLSFQVPGAEYSEFYAEDCAFKNLNSELYKIIGLSKSFDFHWQVIDSSDDIDTKVTQVNFKRLKEILTNQCSETQSFTLTSNNLRTYSKNTGSRSCASLVVGSELMTKSSETGVEQSKEKVVLAEEDGLLPDTDHLILKNSN